LLDRPVRLADVLGARAAASEGSVPDDASEQAEEDRLFGLLGRTR
jgi:hypothetical protein